MKRRIAVILCAALFVLTACGTGGGGATTGQTSEAAAGATTAAANAGSGTTTAAPASQASATEAAQVPAEVATLTGYISYGGNAVGVEKAKWYTDYLLENLGIVLEFQESAGSTGDNVIQRLMASGELPDIVGISSPTDANNAAAAGLLLKLDDHQAALPSIFENDLFDSSVSFYRDTMSGNTGGLYLMPTAVGIQDSINYNPHLRWDIYRQVGMPAITTLEDYIPVLREMQDAYPTTPDGQSVYGLAIFSDWDGNTMGNATYLASIYGVDSEYVSPFVETPFDGVGEQRSILDDGSVYKRVLDFFYAANKAGILDPDSVTQKWENVSDKFKNGRVLFSTWEWACSSYNTLEHTDVENFTGYQPVWADDFKMPVWADGVTGRNWCLGIGSATKNPDAALRFLNFLYSYEGCDLIQNGPEGVLWETGSDGLRYVTDEGWNIIDNQLEMPGGGLVVDAPSVINSPAITGATLNPATNGQTIDRAFWESSLTHNKTRLIEDWRSVNNGAINMYYKAKDEGQYLIKSTPALQMMKAPPDDLQLISTQIGNVVKTNSWKMVFAANDEEYDALWKEMQETAAGLGVDQVIQWAIDEFAVAKAQLEKYQ